MSDLVLITGGLGYVGSRIAKYLSDNSDYRLRITTRHKSVETPDWLKNSEIVPIDLISDKDIESACNSVRHIIHLAALNEIDSQKDPALALTVNGLGSLRLLKAAEKAGVERFIYFSTAHIYGSPLQGTITEKSLPIPVHPYAITHRTAEDFILAAQDQKTLTGIVLRLSNGFGVPIQRDMNRWTLLVNDLCRQAVTTGKLVLRSTGLQKRDFITLLDVCRAVGHFLKLPANQCDNGLFNLGGEKSLKTIDMANHVSKRCHKVLGFKPEIILPKSSDNNKPTMLEYRIGKLKSTGFELKGDLNAEIDATLLFCQKFFGQRE